MKESFSYEPKESLDLSSGKPFQQDFALSKLKSNLSAALIACSSMITACFGQIENSEAHQQPIPEEKVEAKKIGFGAVSFNADFVAFQGVYEMTPIIIQAYLDGVYVGESDVIPPGRFKFELPYTTKNKRVDFKAYQANENGDLGREIPFTNDPKKSSPDAMVVIASGMSFDW